MEVFLQKARNNKHSIGRAAIFIGLGFVVIGGLGITTRVSAIDPTFPIFSEAFKSSQSIKFPPIHFDVVDRGISLDIAPGAVHSSGVWDVNRNGLSYLTISALPGSGGNVVVYGHNWKGLLGPILDATIGEQIELTSQDGGKYVYEITEIFDVTPRDTSILLPTDTETLTVYTCSGLLNQYRRVFRATPVL